MRWPRHLDWLTAGARVHFLGIGGSGMSGLAELLAAEGYRVSGCDAVSSPVLEHLAQRGIAVTIGHNPEHAEDTDLLVVTSAVRVAHPEVTAFAIRHRPIVKRAALLGWLTADYLTIAVAGTHGKSTTSGMIALALEVAGLRPGFAIGATVRDLGGTSAQPSRGQFFVVEADEYDYSFLAFEPYIAVVLNVDHDHPDLFPSHGSVVRAFRRFLERLRPDGVAVLSADDPVTRVFASELSAAGRRVFTFGTAADAQYRVLPDGSLRSPDGTNQPLALAVPGWHNRINAAAAVAAGAAAGVPVLVVLQALRCFSGVGRRFEECGVVEGVPVILDYAHHPREVAATIAAARERYPEARLWVVFQPHTYSRTQLFLDQFAHALEQADIVVVTDVYPARELPLPGVNGVALAQRIQRVPAIAVPNPDAAAATVRAAMQDGDVVLVLGAGDIWKAAVALREGERDASAR
ncbi:UDP-N-acetylmuramate--L-alanine ligase [Thermomicrobium sp. CFH 73360]|uniref:UDP-N-acetylmuramate--L-alanine ligase n=1 Tax=Thermomicrobium sp. CFH 73360 TaxID=2951987 RepID=UPI0020768B30|nr:UDP-N-acetylmuramate--L-alanine ligase [Thermomicrobium sp. CFH 73360]MCM8745360.1 UDP-N-acetylmuramate--L-alanine ligase [Thermomicrobium sp. CFH 73360]